MPTVLNIVLNDWSLVVARLKAAVFSRRFR